MSINLVQRFKTKQGQFTAEQLTVKSNLRWTFALRWFVLLLCIFLLQCIDCGELFAVNCLRWFFWQFTVEQFAVISTLWWTLRYIALLWFFSFLWWKVGGESPSFQCFAKICLRRTCSAGNNPTLVFLLWWIFLWWIDFTVKFPAVNC
jgi:hypothetical protein